MHVLSAENPTAPLIDCAGNKNKADYDMIFSILRQVRPDPVSVIIDYERAAANSVTSCFPNIHIRMCFLFRRVLSDWYNNPRNVITMKSIKALTFVPASDIADIFMELVSSLSDESGKILSGVLALKQHGLRLFKQGKRWPLFELRMWNTFETTVHDLPRTLQREGTECFNGE